MRLETAQRRSEKQISNAVFDIQSGMSFPIAARLHRVPVTMAFDCLHALRTSRVRTQRTALLSAEEDRIVKLILHFAD